MILFTCTDAMDAVATTGDTDAVCVGVEQRGVFVGCEVGVDIEDEREMRV